MSLSNAIAIAPDGLRPFLQFIAGQYSNDNDPRTEAPPLFATYTAPDGGKHRVRVVTAAQTGRVGITDRLQDETTPQRYVPTRTLSQFLPTPYPMRPVRTVVRARTRADAIIGASRQMDALLADIAAGKDIIRAVEYAASIRIADKSRASLLVSARRCCIGFLVARDRQCVNDIAIDMGCSHPSVVAKLKAIGLHDTVTSGFDMPFLRALWLRGRADIGDAPGQMPRAVVDRLSLWLDAADGVVEPAALVDLRVDISRAIFAEQRAA